MKKLILLMLVLVTFNITATEMTDAQYTQYQIEDFFSRSKYANVSHIITALAVLESGWFKSPSHICRNNYFSHTGDKTGHDCSGNICKKAICHLSSYTSMEKALEAQLTYFESMGFPVDEKGFYEALKCIPFYKKPCRSYAVDPNHIKKIKIIVRRMEKKKKKELINIYPF